MRRTTFLTVAALGLGWAAPAVAHVPPDGARGGEPVARAASLADTIETRTRFFGAENVDQATGAVRRDRVLFSWVGVSGFAMAMRGHVVLLDAWVPRGLHEGYVPTTPAELAALKPEHVLLGHAHFDHAADAVPIAQASGAPIVGLGEHCAEMRSRAAGMPPRCIEVLPAGAPSGTSAPVDLLPGVRIVAMKHLHSAIEAPDGQDGYHVPVLPTLSAAPLQHPPSPATMAETVAHVPDAEGGSVLYRFEVGGTSFVWHDTSGPLKEQSPGTLDALRALRPVDVELGAIQSFNQFTNGMRDPRMYLEALRPEIFVPTHHDDWAPGITGPASTYRAPLAAELARLEPAQRPEVRFLEDPRDYVRPFSFDVALEAQRLIRRCTGAGVLRAGLGGDVADVEQVRFRLGRSTRAVDAAPWTLSFPRREVARRGRQLVAEVTERGGERRVLRRRAPSCGVR